MEAVFEVNFEKSRGFTGEDAEAIQLSLTEVDGLLTWKYVTVEDTTFKKVIALANDGVAQIDIATELGIHKSSVSRHLKLAKQQGLINDKN